MAALLVAMSIMAVMLTVAMPVWKQMVQREKEEELIFRGMQYAHAIGMFQRKYANAYPPSIDVLVNERFLRRKFKDPITNSDFVPIPAGSSVPGPPGAPGSPSQPGGPGRGGPQTGSMAPQTSGPGAAALGGPGTQATGGPGTPAIGGPGGTAVGGIMGVTSKSKDKSIRLYNGRSHYNEWQFVWTPQTQTPGAGAPGTAAPGQPAGGQQNPFTPSGGGPTGGQRGRGGPGGPGRGGSPGGFNPFQPPNPQQPIGAPAGGRSGN